MKYLHRGMAALAVMFATVAGAAFAEGAVEETDVYQALAAAHAEAVAAHEAFAVEKAAEIDAVTAALIAERDAHAAEADAHASTAAALAEFEAARDAALLAVVTEAVESARPAVEALIELHGVADAVALLAETLGVAPEPLAVLLE